MAEVIKMPRMSDTMTEGVIVEWHKKVGDKVKPGDLLAEVETDKATMELESYNEGTLLYIGVEKGKSVAVDGVLAVVGNDGEDYKGLLEGEKKPEAKKDDAPAPKENEKKETPKEEKNIKESGSSQVSPPAGGGDLPTGQAGLEGVDTRMKASPLAKKLAADKGIDISQINGSGDGGRIVKKDVDSYKETRDNRQQTTESKQQDQQRPVQPFAQTGQEGYQDIQLSQMRKTIARRLSESNFTAPHFFLTMEINMDNAITSRQTINEVSPVKISFNDMIIKAAAMALRQHPAVNS
nr:2-oxo acid dehydrogenase subunit E2 [Chitinophagaceae bacterium]